MYNFKKLQSCPTGESFPTDRAGVLPHRGRLTCSKEECASTRPTTCDPFMCTVVFVQEVYTCMWSTLTIVIPHVYVMRDKCHTGLILLLRHGQYDINELCKKITK